MIKAFHDAIQSAITGIADELYLDDDEEREAIETLTPRQIASPFALARLAMEIAGEPANVRCEDDTERFRAWAKALGPISGDWIRFQRLQLNLGI